MSLNLAPHHKSVLQQRWHFSQIQRVVLDGTKSEMGRAVFNSKDIPALDLGANLLYFSCKGGWRHELTPQAYANEISLDLNTGEVNGYYGEDGNPLLHIPSFLLGDAVSEKTYPLWVEHKFRSILDITVGDFFVRTINYVLGEGAWFRASLLGEEDYLIVNEKEEGSDEFVWTSNLSREGAINRVEEAKQALMALRNEILRMTSRPVGIL